VRAILAAWEAVQPFQAAAGRDGEA
jgi:hypothetical protein